MDKDRGLGEASGALRPLGAMRPQESQALLATLNLIPMPSPPVQKTFQTLLRALLIPSCFGADSLRPPLQVVTVLQSYHNSLPLPGQWPSRYSVWLRSPWYVSSVLPLFLS